MKRTNKILLVLITTVFIMMLASCKSCKPNVVDVNDDPTNIPEDYPQRNITINYWHANGQALTAVLEEIAESFTAYYEEKLGVTYKVEQRSLGDYETLRTQLRAALSGEIQPHAAQTYPDHVALYNQSHKVRALDKYIEHPEYGISAEEQEQFIEGFWNEGTIYDAKGTRYAVPFNKSTELMYYNKTLFEKYGWSVPKTWDEVVTIAEAWKATSEYQAIAAKYPGQVFAFGIDSEANAFITLTQQWDATFTSFTNNKGVFNAFGANAEDTRKSKEAANFLLTNFKNGNIATSQAFATDYCSDAFKNGQCIMTLGSSAGSSYNDGSQATIKFETGVAAVPQKDINHGQVIQQGTNVSLFKSKDPEEELVAWLWIKYLISYESALKWAIDTSYFPIRKDVLNSAEYQNHILGNEVAADGTIIEGVQSLAAKAKQAGLSQQNWFFTNVAFPNSAKAREEGELIIQQILYGNKSIDAAYKESYNALNN